MTEAARAVGRSKATIIRAIASGMLSATRDVPGKPWKIDPAELTRAFPEPAHDPVHEPDHDALRTAVIREKDTLIAAHEVTIADLRQRLDDERAERRQTAERLAAAQERMAALLMDQRAKPGPAAEAPPLARRRWWRWQRKLGIAAMMWFAACEPALAAETGNILLQNCLAPAHSGGHGLCLGYVTGVTEALSWYGARLCVPNQATRGQLVDITVRYLQAHPEERHYSAVILVAIALVDAFPCQR